MFRQFTSRWRHDLGIADPPAPDDARAWAACYRTVRYRFEAIARLMDPSPFPKNRRHDHQSFLMKSAALRAARSQEELDESYARLEWFANQVIEATLTLLPREARRRWKGSIGVDATLVRSFARGPKRPKGQTRRGKKREIMVHSVDPDAGWYSREKDERDDGTEQRPGMDKPAYGYDLALAVAAPDDGSEDADFPSVIMGMAVLDRPSHEPGRNGARALASVRARGHPAHYLAADRAYSSAKAEDFQLPVRALGYRPVYDYKVDQLGVKAAACGFLQVEGQWVCPMMPQPLIDATADYRAKRIDRSTYEARLAERQRYRARRKGKPDVEGHVRLFCPAAGPHPLARCERKPASIRRAPAGSARIVLPAQADELRPECCVQETVTVAPEAGAKFAQDLPYASPEWQNRYNSLRNATEGANGFLKDPAHEALDDRGRRRLHGVAKESILVAFLILAANVRKIRGFLERAAIVDRKMRRLSRRRRSRSITHWHPETPRVDRDSLPDPPSSA